jgi:acyl carrier protein
MENTTITRESIEERLVEALEELGPERDDIKREATLESLDIDSLDIVELAQMVEDEWGVEIKAEDAKHIRTVGEAFDLVIGRVLASAA